MTWDEFVFEHDAAARRIERDFMASDGPDFLDHLTAWHADHDHGSVRLEVTHFVERWQEYRERQMDDWLANNRDQLTAARRATA
jgi:hypothetical protein